MKIFLSPLPPLPLLCPPLHVPLMRKFSHPNLIHVIFCHVVPVDFLHTHDLLIYYHYYTGVHVHTGYTVQCRYF